MNKIALISGASSGIGKSISLNLNQNHFDLILLGQNVAHLLELKNEIEDNGGKAEIHAGNFCDQSYLVELEQKLVQKKIDVVINNAGFGGPFHPIHELSNDQWIKTFQINTEACFKIIKYTLPSMLKYNFGRIINISSTQGLFGAAGSSAYCASKHALIGLTKSVACEVGDKNITCNAICPGYIETNLINSEFYSISKRTQLIQKIPKRRFGRPEEIAQLILFLIGTNSEYINGSTITIDGGLSSSIDSTFL
jgi:3-oxoacyl-[acyl-carrier protein] reductase